MRKYFSFAANEKTADIVIYGDITSGEIVESDVSSYSLSRRLAELGGVSQINVHINSYGGEVAEGWAIHNALKNHKAKIVTICDGFACSAAAIIFMAGDERLMNVPSALMIHNAHGGGDAADLEMISRISDEAFLGKVKISPEELRGMMKKDTWITPEEAVAKGFATGIVEASAEKPAQNALKSLLTDVLEAQRIRQQREPEPTPEPEPALEPEPEPKPDTPEEPAQNKWSGFFNAILNMKN